METNLFTNAAAQNSNPAGVALNGASNEGRDMFTKLLVAQIQNQDPLSPQDPSQFVQQLTQLSQTEALQNLANLTTANASVLQSMQVLAMGAQVGSDVMVQSSQVTLDGHKVTGEATLGSSSAKTSLVLAGSNGQQYEIVMGTLPAARATRARRLPYWAASTAFRSAPPVALPSRLIPWAKCRLPPLPHSGAKPRLPPFNERSSP
jgi:flagellar basal-body rod modification protein FlgD